MTVSKKIAFWTAWITIIIIKLPIAIVSALILWIELSISKLQMRLAKWSGCDELIEGANEGVDILIKSTNSLRDDYLDMKIEL